MASTSRSRPSARKITRPTSAPSSGAKKASPRERKRRSPEEAKRTILDAALALLAHHGPDAIGLKDVAKKAGVSHALISHYFGTYDALVEAAFALHLTEQRERGLKRILNAPANPEAWLEVAFDDLADPLTGRLLVWAMLTGRLERDDFVILRDRGLQQTVNVLEAYLFATGVKPERDMLERGTMIGLCAAIGYSLGRTALWGSLGRRANAERDAAFRKQLAETLLASLPKP